MPRPIVALLTDFGARDHYAGAMKGAVLSVCPDATLVDISHEMDPFDVDGAALELAAARPYFPPGTVFLVVVDPGVGSGRRGVAVGAGGQVFVGPDNGVLSAVLEDAAVESAVDLAGSRFARPAVSRTFEGRDRFGPVAGWLAGGTPLADVGLPLDPSTLVRMDAPGPVSDARGMSGRVRRVDRFGNLVTNIRARALDAFRRRAALQVEVGGQHIGPLVETYADVQPGTLCALVGSSGWLEIAVHGGSAAARLGAGAGTTVRVS